MANNNQNNNQNDDKQRDDASAGEQTQAKDTNPGNFANDRQRASEAGRKGGQASTSSADTSDDDI